MPLEYQETRDGYLICNEQGRALCRIETKRVIQYQVIQAPDNRQVWLEKAEELPQEQWMIHFCAGKRTPAEIKELSLLLDSLPDV